jgi:hypothetical protein
VTVVVASVRSCAAVTGVSPALGVNAAVVPQWPAASSVWRCGQWNGRVLAPNRQIGDRCSWFWPFCCCERRLAIESRPAAHQVRAECLQSERRRRRRAEAAANSPSLCDCRRHLIEKRSVRIEVAEPK